MKYKQIYDLLIQKRRLILCNKSKDQYCEYHHIIPLSLGGENTPRNKNYNHLGTNIIGLTAREHYVAHLLLWKYYKSINDKNAEIKMMYALHRLIYGNIEFNNNLKITNIISSHKYDYIKKEFSKLISKKFTNSKRYHNNDGKIIVVNINDINALTSEWKPGTGLHNASTKNYHYIRNINTNEVRCVPDNTPLELGWIFSGKTNTTNNTCWITNDNENKKIKKYDKLPDGYRYGRTLSEKFKIRSQGKTNGTKDLKLITNIKTGKHKYISVNNILNYIFNGSNWIVGNYKPRVFSQVAKNNIIIGHLKKNYPNIDFSQFDIDFYRTLTKYKKQKYLKTLALVH